MIQHKAMSYYIFKKNYKKLHKYHSKIRKPFRYHESSNLDNKEKMNIFKLYRLWHNFFSSSSSLIDHTRIVANKLKQVEEDTDFEFTIEYKKMIKNEFQENPLHNFMKDFRNMIIHKQQPSPTTLKMQVSRTKDKNIYLFEELGPIIEYDIINEYKWSSKSKEFINEHKDNGICIYQISTDYYTKVKKLHRWIDKKIIKAYDIYNKSLDDE